MKTKQIIKALRADGDPTRYLATEAANRLEMLSVEQKKLYGKLADMKEERDALASIVRNISACTHCKHISLNTSDEPCKWCHEKDNYPYWEWRGAKDTNVPNKKEENHA